MSASASIAAGAAASSAASAAAAARAAHEAQCRVSMPRFDPGVATIEEKREYAGCVDLFYPQPLGAESVIAFKVLFVLALVGGAIGAWRFGLPSWADWTDYLMGFVVGFLLLPLGVAAFVGIAIGVVWLFT